MESIVELYVNGPITGTTVGKVSLYGNEPISLIYSITDIKDISKRNSSKSQNFNVPADDNNNILFNHIFNIGSDSSFDPTRKYPAYMLVDFLPVITGNLQLTNIQIRDQKPVSYDIVIYGESVDLVKSLGDKYLTDLNFSELDHVYSVENIMASWTANTAQHGFFYPLVDYGFDWSLTELNTGIIPGVAYTGYTSNGGGLSPTAFKPAISNKYLWDKIFLENGFSYESDFINSDVFTETIIPCNENTDNTLTADYMYDYSFRAADMAGQSIPPGYYVNIITFTNTTTGQNFDAGNLFNQPGAPWRYTADRPSAMQFGAQISVIAGGTISSPKYFDFYFTRSTYAGNIGGITPTGCFSVSSQIVNSANGGDRFRFNFESQLMNDPNHPYLYPVQPGETFALSFLAYGGAGGAAFSLIGGADQTYFYNVPSPQLVPSGDVLYNEFIPKKIKQIDYVKSVITMFNLMVIPDKNNPKRLTFVPRNDYYASGRVKDWTSLIDTTDPCEITLISEQQNRQIKFSYKEDKDYLNTFYKDDTAKVYGEYIKNIDNQWLDSKSVQNIDIIFSPTPMENVEGTSEIIVPKIGKLDSNGTFGKSDSNIRFLRKAYLETISGATITMLGMSAQTFYPYASHLDSPFDSTIDYNFGTIDFAFYNTPGFANLQAITPNNLINGYWKQYLDDISDKNSKLIKCKLKLTPADIADFDYNDNIYLSGLTEDGGNYYIVNKITYIPTANGAPSVVELIKINRTPSSTFVSNGLKANRRTIKRNVMILGDSSTRATRSMIIGNGNVIDENAENSIVIGANNYVANTNINSFVSGNQNVINNSINATVFGNNNYIFNPDTGTTSSTTLSNITILGTNNYTATTSDTLYVPNIQLTTTGGTINGVTINNIIEGSTYWTAGTGTDSIILNNNTGNIAQGTNSFVAGQFNQTIEVTLLNGNSILGGGNNIIAG